MSGLKFSIKALLQSTFFLALAHINSSQADTLFDRKRDRLLLQTEPASGEFFLIPVTESATQETLPFRFYGAVMNSSHPRWEQYKNAVQSHPDILSCFPKLSVVNGQLDLLQFDWSSPRDGPALDVCLFRILTAIHKPELTADWFRHYGFDIHIFSDASPNRPPVESEPRMGFDATISSETLHVLRGSWLYRLTGLDFAQGYTCSVRFSSDLKLVGVGCLGNLE